MLARQASNEAQEQAVLAEQEPDWIDRSSDEQLAGMLERLSAAERQEVVRIDAALRRRLSGEYGACASCGQEIDTGRLELMPWVTLCKSCAEDEEREARQRRIG
jgi:RNA polymerase-binding transcription factor DksA